MNTGTEVGITLNELVSVAAVIVGALWALGKLALAQFKTLLDQRFQTIDAKLKTFDPLHGELVRIDKDLLKIQLDFAEKSKEFVRQDGLLRLDEKISRLFSEVFDKLDNKADKSECAIHHNGRRE